MLEILTPKIEYIEGEDERYGRFIIEPLDGGFGITIGNALRRVLLALLPGAAVTAVKIEEVDHEISTIHGIKEDTMEFLLNIKEIRLRPLSDQQGILTLNARGERKFTAGDINTSADFEIANPELHLVTLDSEDAKLNVEFYVEHGKGYTPAGHVENLPIGVIPVDAIYTPIRKVNYTVEKIRIGQFSNCDRLIFDVWTDGTISATEAVNKSAQIMIDGLSLFRNLDKKSQQELAEPISGLAVSSEQYNIPIEQLGLSVRTLNSLRRGKLTIVGEVLEKTDDELLKEIKNFGRKSLDELWERLEALGLASYRRTKNTDPATRESEEDQEPEDIEDNDEA